MKNKIIYASVLLVTLVWYLLFQAELPSFLFAYELILLPVLWLLSEYLKRNVTAQLVIPAAYIQKNQEFTAEVHLKNKSILPMPCVIVKISYKNEFTGEIFYSEETAMMDAKGEAVLRFFMKSGYCGKVCIGIEEIKVQDYLCLFSKKVLSEKLLEEVMVLPVIHKIAFNAVSWFSNKQQGEEYSHARSGEDTSEVFDVHEYRFGDTFQRVHWKLTAKADEYLVKEYSMPIEQTILLFLDFYCEKKEEFNQEKLDCFLEVLASFSWSMMEQGWKHTIFWYHEEEGQLKQIQVNGEQDVYFMLEQVCNEKIQETNTDMQELYLKQFGSEQGKNFLLDINGRFFRDGTFEKQFSQEYVEKELIEWKLEI